MLHVTAKLREFFFNESQSGNLRKPHRQNGWEREKKRKRQRWSTTAAGVERSLSIFLESRVKILPENWIRSQSLV